MSGYSADAADGRRGKACERPACQRRMRKERWGRVAAMRRTLTGRVATVGTTAFESTATRTTPEPPVPLCRREWEKGSKRGGVDAQECLCLSERWKAFDPAIVRTVLRRFRRPHHDKFAVHPLDDLG